MTHELRFSLDHFSSHLVHLMYPMPQSDSPWSNVFLSRVSQVLVESSNLSDHKSPLRSLLCGILSMGFYHADRVYRGRGSISNIVPKGGSGMAKERVNPPTNSWNLHGARYQTIAWRALDTCLRADHGAELQDDKLIELIVALLNLVAVEVSQPRNYTAQKLTPTFTDYCRQ